MAFALYVVSLIAIAVVSVLLALHLTTKAELLAREWEKPRSESILASDSLPEVGKAGFLKPSSWTSVVSSVLTIAVVLAYAGTVQWMLGPLEEARNDVLTHLPFCTPAQAKPRSAQAVPTCADEVAHITGRFAEGRARLAENQWLVLGFAFVAVMALLFVPHGAYWFHTKWFHNDRHVLTPKAFIHQTHLATITGLLFCSVLAFVVTHYGKSLQEAGNGVADIGSNVISPLTFDAEQYIKTLTTYGPMSQSKKVVDDIVHIRSALHIVSAQSFILLLILFEILKESFIKPILKEGVSEFRHTPEKKGENKNDDSSPRDKASCPLSTVANFASTGATGAAKPPIDAMVSENAAPVVDQGSLPPLASKLDFAATEGTPDNVENPLAPGRAKASQNGDTDK
ncbi:hypothetical protein AWB78_02374 [Caballeronia calidae]|uniref:Uncharacterized protein n=1 Tax=Caballeronia calidae TaxID=1777139 RepID=A0A158B7D7_9BURK|nr:hypothetical protein [Caballeronia calidae]SAK65982.1 hypothetical protein AWB78_02374 [Caballeronia calidae]